MLNIPQSSSIANISCLKRERFEKAEHEKDHIDLYFAQKIIWFAVFHFDGNNCQLLRRQMMHLPYYTLLVYKPVISISAEVNELFSLHPQVSLFTLLYHQGLLVAAAAK